MLIPSDPVHAFVDYRDVDVPHATSGPLAGLSFAVKDIYDVAGYPTGCGSPEKTAEDPAPTRHAACVEKLLDSGAAFVGKTHTAELAFSLDGRNEHYGTPLNPAAPGRVPGGSSSGSAAAVAAGLVDFALGSDTGGSVRGPASFCGIIGLRPTFGRIDISGTMPLAAVYDTVGWFTRDIDTYARVGGVLLGEDVSGPPLARMVVADEARAIFAADNDAAILDAAVARVAGQLASDGTVEVAEGEGLARWYDAYRTIQGYHAWRAHGPWIESRKPALNPAVVTRFAAAKAVTQAAHDEAAAFRAPRRRAGRRYRRRGRRYGAADDAGHRAAAGRERGGVRALPRPRRVDAVHRRTCRLAAALAADDDGRWLPGRPVTDRPAGPRSGADRARWRHPRCVTLSCRVEADTLPAMGGHANGEEPVKPLCFVLMPFGRKPEGGRPADRFRRGL